MIIKYYKLYDKILLNESITLFNKNRKKLTSTLQLFDSLDYLIIKDYNDNLIEININTDDDYIDFETKLKDIN